MRRIKSTYLVAVAVLLSPVAAYSDSILGDEVTVSYDFLAIGSPQCGAADVKTTTVSADSSDAVTVLDCFNGLILTVDMNARGFESQWEALFDLTFVDPFDGLVISDLDWSPGSPTNFSISTNIPGWSDAFANFTANSMMFNFAEMNVGLPTGDYFFNVQAVPEPGTLILLGIGLAGMGFARRRRET